MFSIIQAAGWPIWFLLLASVIAVALIIERGVALRHNKVVPPGLLQRVAGEFRQGTINASALEQLENDSPLGQVFAAGLRNASGGREVIKEAVEEAGHAVAHELEGHAGGVNLIQLLGTVASIAPLMGLFGTVVGMIEIFGSATGAGNNPQALAHGISVALYNTGFGLLIAIPSMILYRHFRALIDSFVVELEQQAVKLVEILHNERS